MKRQTDECRAWLESHRELRVEANRLWNRHLRLADQATRMTSQISAVPGGGGSDREKLLAALADSDGEAVEKYAQAEDRMHEIEDFIDQLPTRSSRIILRYRYIELLRWQDIEKAMAKNHMNYTLDHIYRMHGAALKEARRAWNERSKSNA